MECAALDREDQLPEPEMQDTRRRCPACTAFVRLSHTFLDTNKGKSVHLYECQCGERIWED